MVGMTYSVKYICLTSFTSKYVLCEKAAYVISNCNNVGANGVGLSTVRSCELCKIRFFAPWRNVDKYLSRRQISSVLMALKYQMYCFS